MDKMKVHELAKELGIQSKEVISFLAEKGIEAKAAISSVEGEAIDLVRKKFGAKAQEAPAKAPEKEEKPAPEKKAEKLNRFKTTDKKLNLEEQE